LGGNASQDGKALADLLLVGSTVARAPLALLAVAKTDGWSTLAFGAEPEALEDPEVFSIIAGHKEPVEVTEPSANPALAHSRLARSSLGIRWLLGVPLLGPAGEFHAIFAVLDTRPSGLSRRERAALVAVGRLIAGVLLAHRASEHLGPVPVPAEHANGGRQPPAAQWFLRTREVAALFDVSERTVINWAALGKLACVRSVGGHLRFRREDVMVLLEATLKGVSPRFNGSTAARSKSSSVAAL
jgi:excisionase family DNA binding protein